MTFSRICFVFGLHASTSRRLEAGDTSLVVLSVVSFYYRTRVECYHVTMVFALDGTHGVDAVAIDRVALSMTTSAVYQVCGVSA